MCSFFLIGEANQLITQSFLYRYGAGYNLNIEKEASCDVTELTQLVQSEVDGAELVLDIGAEVQFSLPQSMTKKFSDVLNKLEGNLSYVGDIISFR